MTPTERKRRMIKERTSPPWKKPRGMCDVCTWKFSGRGLLRAPTTTGLRKSGQLVHQLMSDPQAGRSPDSNSLKRA